MTTAVAVVGAAACAVPAQAAIEVDHGIEFVGLTELPANTDLVLTIFDPDDNPIGTKLFNVGNTDAIELNHDGPPCFDNVTPDIRPGDRLEVSSQAGGVLQSHTVGDVRYSAGPASDGLGGTTYNGWIRPGDGAEIVLRGTFPVGVTATGGQLEEKVPGERLIIVPDLDAQGNFSVTISGGVAAEAVVSGGTEPGNVTMFSGDAGGAPLGCPAFGADRGPVTVPPFPDPPADTDGDGVIDAIDDCDTVDGPVGNDGCPFPVPPGGGTQSGGSTQSGGTSSSGGTTAVSGTIPLAGATPAAQNVLGSSASNAPRVGNLSLAQRISSTRLRLQGLRTSMRLPNGTRAVRIAVYKARNGQRTGSALFTTNRAPRVAGVYRVTLRDRALLRKLKAGSYVMEVRAGRSAAALGTVTRIAFTVTR